MIINEIIIEKFKRVEYARFNLSKVNVLIGGNNSGKSSILQAIHFSVTASAIARQQQLATFSSDLLLYNPTPDFTLLKNGTPYRNFGEDNSSTLTVNAVTNEGQNPVNYVISLNKGRNHGNIGCRRYGDQVLGQLITDPNNLFSIYVPGLAGIPQSEELRSMAIVRRGVASGDANLYLRNVIYYISKINKLDHLNRSLNSVFPGMTLSINFDEEKDTSLIVNVLLDGRLTPLELVGTGVLQIIQILSYITYFNPRLLLLDEPDSHLHPNNQITLAHTLNEIAESTNTQILLCTHSRHIIDALYGDANFIWMRKGIVQEQGDSIDRLPLLMDIGALDDFDKFRQGKLKAVFLTEDRDTSYLKKLISSNGFNLEEILIFSYKTSSNLEQASLFVDFIREVANNCKVIIHRDRDFMTDIEVSQITKKIKDANAIPFITRPSDIEGYFIHPKHISTLLEVEEQEVTEWIEEIALNNHIEIQHQFTRKRDEVKNKLYIRKSKECPDTLILMGKQIPLPVDKRKGKYMIKKIRGGIFQKFNKDIDITSFTPFLKDSELEALKELISEISESSTTA